MSDVDSILNSMEVIDQSQYRKEKELGGKSSSKYAAFQFKAEELEPGQVFKSNKPVNESTLQGIRRAVYKLNDDDSEEKEFTVERQKVYKDGKPKTDSNGNDLFKFYIKRSG